MYVEVIVGKAIGKGASLLTYTSSLPLSIGSVVEVPLMRGKAPAVVYKKVAQPKFKCREITRILYSKPLPEHLLKTAVWMSEYYVAPLSGVMGMILPTGVLKKRRSGAKTEQTEQTAQNNTFSTRSRRPVDPSGRPRPKGRSVTGGASLARSPLVANGLESTISEPPIPLNHAQKKALQGLQKGLGGTKLLFGVTGSGKTNIYLTEAARALSGQKSVVLLVPEIALTGQLVKVFKETFGEIVTVIHSKQTEVERHQIFDSLLFAGTPRIVIGPRSALFAPLSDLGLIIIDEEHESTYYQENTPKYSAIRVASKMAELCKCPCILGSATPTLEDFYLARKKGSLVTLSEKAKETAVKPEVSIIDFKNRDNFTRNRYFSNALLKSITNNLEQGRQTLIFHNRRGSSPLTICENCGEELLCPTCFLPLTLHVDTYEMHCHTCGYKCKVPVACPKCGGSGLIHKGFGTKLLETELKRLFPKARVKRFDADNKKGEGLEAVYDSVRDGEVDILVGTQTLAKGLDLPLLATVGVVQADAGLSLPDFSAEERVFQLITQVMGRVGRGHLNKAEVFIQTFRPEHPVINFAIKEDYLGFSEYLLKKRQKSGFPPFKFVGKAAVTMKTEAATLKKIRTFYNQLSKDSRFLVSPPQPAFHERTVRGFTWEVVVRSSSRKALMEAFVTLDNSFHASLDLPSLL
ncbi:MAG: primosomal protein N' [Candidatus Saccharibacteria bacterium]|nr:primosomal protein N' [Candidatus Saccharibacteria bacterium]